LLHKRLEGVDLAVVAPLNELDLSKGTLSNDLECREVVRPLLCTQKSQVLDLSTAHVLFFADLSAVGDTGLFEEGFNLECSVTVLILVVTLCCCSYVPLVSVACPLDTVLEEGIDQALGDHGLLLDVFRVLARVFRRGLLVVQRILSWPRAALTSITIPPPVVCGAWTPRVRRGLSTVWASRATIASQVLVRELLSEAVRALVETLTAWGLEVSLLPLVLCLLVGVHEVAAAIAIAVAIALLLGTPDLLLASLVRVYGLRER
jgi:hypothetical protein